jgi:hypothetical protein
MAELCNEPHPELPQVLCDKPKPCWAYHQNVLAKETWGVREMPQHESATPGALIRMARRIRDHEK